MKANNEAVKDMKIKILQAPPTSAISLLKLDENCESGFPEVSFGMLPGSSSFSTSAALVLEPVSSFSV